jgi:hypothetical protein
MTGDESAKRRSEAAFECPSRVKHTLWDLVKRLESDPAFAQFFFDLLKRANENEPAAIACVDSYYEPTTEELQELGVSASQMDNMRRCTDSGLLVAVVAKASSGRCS